MPVYEYQCKACQKEFEYQQRMSDPDKTTCEACGGGLERVISRTAFQLKGSGWYKDLYSSQKPSGDGKPDAAATAGSSEKAAASDKGGAAPSTPAAAGSSSSGSSTTGSSGGSSTGGGSTGGGSTSTGAAAAKAP